MDTSLKSELEWHLARIAPTSIVKKEIKTVRDIYEKRGALKLIRGEPSDLNHLLNLVVNALKKNEQFRRVYSIKILKRIFKNRDSKEGLPQEIIDSVFWLYKYFIFHPNEDVQWAVSVMLKNQQLSNDQIGWLFEHWEESEQILNRILRYPFFHPAICKWVKEQLQKSWALEHRRSELLAWVIRDSIPITSESDTPSIQAWAIYYSHTSAKTKERLLMESVDESNLWDVVEIAERLDFPRIITSLIDSSEDETGGT